MTHYDYNIIIIHQKLFIGFNEFVTLERIILTYYSSNNVYILLLFNVDNYRSIIILYKFAVDFFLFLISLRYSI